MSKETAGRPGVGDVARFAYAVLTAAVTLVLLCFGGLVTSKGAGMAVPDWPTTFGYNMFFFPWSMMVGGIFYEHSHRLMGALVGVLAVGLMAWIWWKEPRRWLKGAAAAAVILVVIQGVLGGLRVIWATNEIGIIHAVSGQSFFVLVAAIALWSSGYWRRVEAFSGAADPAAIGRITRTAGVVLALTIAQLVIASTMRHAHRGLSIPDFPLAYGKIWPSVDQDSLAAINTWRGDKLGLPSTTGTLIWLQLIHRYIAAVIVVGSCALWVQSRRIHGVPRIGHWALAIIAIVGIQFCLGVWTVWSNKAADIATAHMAVGALLLAALSLVLIVLVRLKRPAFQGGFS